MLAQWSEAELIVLTVKDLVRYYGIANYGIVETPGLDKLANDIILKVGSIIPAESKFKTQILSGSPKREIVQYAKENDIDLEFNFNIDNSDPESYKDIVYKRVFSLNTYLPLLG